MNLEQIRKRIEQELRHAPNVKGYRDEIADRVNTAMDELVLSLPWAFRRKRHLLQLKADIELEAADHTDNPALTVAWPSLSSESVTVTASRGFTFTTPSGWVQNRDALDLRGQVCEVSGASAASLNGKWLIDYAYSVNATTTAIILEGRFPEAVATSGNLAAATLNIRFTRYALPEDCADVYGVLLRDTEEGLLQELTRYSEARLTLKEDDTAGTPRTYLVEGNFPGSWPLDTSQYAPHVARAPVDPPTLASTTSGSLVASATYEYRYRWVVAGIVSGPSPVASVTLGASDGTVQITALEAVGSGTDFVGSRKVVERRRIYTDYEGPWVVVKNTYAHDTDVDDTGAVSWPATQELGVDDSTRSRVYDFGETRKHIRFWPQTDADLEAELHYYARAPKLETPSDVPALPPELHMALVHRVVADLAANSDGTRLAAHHEKRLAEILRNARRTYLGHSAVRTAKRGILTGSRGGGIYVNTLGYTS